MSGEAAGVLITGGTGFLARGLVAALLKTDRQRICVYSRGEFAQAQMRRELGDDARLRWFIGDVRDRDRLEMAMEGCAEVIHAAALKRIEVGAYQPGEMVRTNVYGTENVIWAARRAKVQKVLFVSSDKAFEPVSPYGQTKALAESLVLTADRIYPDGPRFAVVRYGNIWKSTGSLIPVWNEILKTSDTVPVTDLSATRFFMWRHEAVSLVLKTISEMRGGETAIPELPAYCVADVALAMGAKMKVIGLPQHEKRHEKMSASTNSEMARRMSIEELRSALNAAA